MCSALPGISFKSRAHAEAALAEFVGTLAVPERVPALERLLTEARRRREAVAEERSRVDLQLRELQMRQGGWNDASALSAVLTSARTHGTTAQHEPLRRTAAPPFPAGLD